MFRHNKLWALLLIGMFALIMAACTPAGPAETQAPPEEETEAAPEETEAATEEAGPKKVVTFAWTQEFDTLNPYYTNMWFSTTTMQIWNCKPWYFDENNAPLPILVTEIPSTENGGISEDGRVITMTLRDDIVWSDGEPITSADFVFIYEMVMDPANSVSSTSPYDDMVEGEGVTAPDPQTVVMTFVDPYAPWLSTTWQYGIMPEHILRPVYEAEGNINNAEWNLSPTVGCGPYNLTEWETGAFTRFERNPNYWGEPAKIDEIFFRFVPDDAAQTAALINGEADLGTFPPISDVPSLQDAGLDIRIQPSGYNEGIYFRVDDFGHPALKDVNVRKAIAMATDREGLNTDLLLGLTKVPISFWDAYPGLTDPSVEVYPYDPEGAMALLDEAGWTDSNDDGTRDKDGTELVLRYGTTNRQIRADTQAVLQEQLAAVGIGVELQSYEADFFFLGYADDGPTSTGQLDMWHYSNAPSWPDPDARTFLCGEVATDENPQGINDLGLCSEELDALFAAQAQEVDPVKRTEIFNQITKLMYEQVWWFGLWQDPDYWIVGSRLTGVKFSGATPLFNIAEWDLTE